MANKRLSLIGQTHGCLTVLEYDESSYGGNDSSWICRCNNCGNMHSVRGYSIRRDPKSCVRCRAKHRNFPVVELPCLHCQTVVSVPNNRAYVYCSKQCKVAATANKRSRNAETSLEKYLASIATGARNRSRKRGLPCEVTTEFLMELYTKQEGKCARTNQVLELSNPSAYKRVAPNTISIDRKDSRLGYTKDNVELVTHFFNSAKNDNTYEDLYELCKLYVRNYEERLSS